MKLRTGSIRVIVTLLVALGGGIAGYWLGPNQQRENIWCSSRFLQPATVGSEPHWLLARLNLDLEASGDGILRIRGRVLDSQGTGVAHMHRYAALQYVRNDQRLRLSIQQAGRSDTDDLADNQIPMVSLSLFQQGAVLSFHVTRLSDSAYLIDNGLGGNYYCKVSATRFPPYAVSER